MFSSTFCLPISSQGRVSSTNPAIALSANPPEKGTMIQEIRMTIRLKPRLAFQIKMRAEEQGITCSEYLRALAQDDLKSGGMADSLAQLNAEVTLVTGMMARRLLTGAVGEEKARSLEEWAAGRAEAIVRNILQE
jgi:hypothetical protein